MLDKFGSRLNNRWLLGALLVVITSAVYFPVIHAGFVWDDRVMVTGNRILRDTEGLHDIWFTTRPADHMPLTLTFFWAQWQLWGNNPLGYHILDVLLHAIAALLFWRVLIALNLPGAWIAAAIFALHPVCVASAAWVSEEKNTFSAVFYLLSLLCYLRFEQQPTKPKYIAALAVFAATLLTKGSVVVFPAVILLIVWWKNGKITRADIIRIVPFFALALAESLATIWFQNHRVIDGQLVQTLTPLGKFLAAGWAVVFYLIKDIIPIGLTALYPTPHFSTAQPLAYLPLIALMIVPLVLWRINKPWSRTILFALAGFVVTLLPVLGFIDMSIFRYTRVADHLQYLAIFVPITLIICGAAAWIHRSQNRQLIQSSIVVAALVLIALTGSTHQRISVYISDQLLWRDNIAKNPQSEGAYNNLGSDLLNEGKITEAQSLLEHALRLSPNSSEALDNMGVVYQRLNDPLKAAAYYEKSVQNTKRQAAALGHWGQNLIDRGELDAGIAKLRTAVDQEPNNVGILEDLATALLQKGDANAALGYAGRALDQQSQDANLHYIAGTCLFQIGRKNEAAGELQRACELQHDHVQAHHNLGIAYLDLGMTNAAATNFVAAAVYNTESPSAAMDDVKEALHLRPDWPEATELAAKLQAAARAGAKQ